MADQQTSAETTDTKPTVLVVGAGPAGLYAARKLAGEGVDVVLLNRDIKPGGLAEYGIYPTKHKMKEGLRKQFRKILETPEITYLGGVKLGQEADITLEDLAALGADATLFTIGAQGTKNLGLPGEDNASGVFHAKDLVYHFNQLPPFADQHFDIGQRVGIIGMGNVMVDVAHWLICDRKVEEVVVIARRGPNERAYTDKEMREIIEVLDQEGLKAEFARIKERLEAVGQNPDEIFDAMQKPMEKAYKTDSPSQLRFRFLVSSKQILTDESGRITGLEVENNNLIPRGEGVKPQGTGEMEVIPLDTLVYAIGDQVDAKVGLPFEWGKYLVPKEPHPSVTDRARYEVYDPEKDAVQEGLFVGGWARIASDGLVGKARADGETAADEVLTYLKDKGAKGAYQGIVSQLKTLFQGKQVDFVTYEDVQQLEATEQARAADEGRDFFKFNTNDEMLDVIRAKRGS